MVNVKRKKGETFESMFRRFNKHLIKSGLVLDFKQRRFRTKPMSRNSQREYKVEYLKRRDKREYLKKIGLIDDSDTRRRRW